MAKSIKFYALNVVAWKLIDYIKVSIMARMAVVVVVAVLLARVVTSANRLMRR
jgi:hypothetical protein